MIDHIGFEKDFTIPVFTKKSLQKNKDESSIGAVYNFSSEFLQNENLCKKKKKNSWHSQLETLTRSVNF